MNDDLVVVYRPPNIVMANMILGVLEADGIGASLRSLQIPMYDDLYQTTTGNWGEVMVRQRNVEKARDVIKKYLESCQNED